MDEYRSWLIGPTEHGVMALDGPPVPENINVIEASQARAAWNTQYERANTAEALLTEALEAADMPCSSPTRAEILSEIRAKFSDTKEAG